MLIASVSFGFVACAVLIAAALKTVFGRELTFGAAGCKINTNSVPDTGTATVVTLAPDLQETVLHQHSMRHAIYCNEMCAFTIWKWMNERVRTRFAGKDQGAT